MTRFTARHRSIFSPVKTQQHVLIVTGFVWVGSSTRFATPRMLNVVKVVTRWTVETGKIVTCWTQIPVACPKKSYTERINFKFSKFSWLPCVYRLRAVSTPKWINYSLYIPMLRTINQLDFTSHHRENIHEIINIWLTKTY
jgi:hypothetical protein